MDKAAKVDEICRALGVTLRRGQRMSNHTALGVGGEIDCIAYPETREMAAQFVAELDKAAISWSALGTGSNLLVGDEPIDRVAVSLKLLEELLIFDGERAHVHGGYRVSRLVTAASERGLEGLEGLAALQGTVGGAVRANDSAHKYSIASVVESVSIARGGEVVNLAAGEVDLGTCDLILGCVMRLQEADAATVRKTTARFSRLSKPETGDVRSADPVFRAKGRSASRLISKLGLSGASYGDAAISERDANRLVNRGAATARDMLDLIDLVRNQVREQSGIEMELMLEIWK